MYAGTVKTTATPYLNVRSGPSTEYGKVGALQPGQAVTVEFIQDGWAKVITPAVSNNVDRQWALAAYMDLIEIVDPNPGGDPVPDPEPARASNVGLSFRYDEQGNLVMIHILEQFSDGATLERDWFPHA